MSFKIGDREELTPIATSKGKIYDALIKAVREKKVAGAYPVEIEGMKAKALYAALANKLKKDKTLRPRTRGEKVYLEIIKPKKRRVRETFIILIIITLFLYRWYYSNLGM